MDPEKRNREEEVILVDVERDQVTYPIKNNGEEPKKPGRFLLAVLVPLILFLYVLSSPWNESSLSSVLSRPHWSPCPHHHHHHHGHSSEEHVPAPIQQYVKEEDLQKYIADPDSIYAEGWEEPETEVVGFIPRVAPLAVRSPYLTTWVRMPRSGSESLPEPIFWTGRPAGWGAALRVDGTTYWLMGQPDVYGKKALRIGFALTSTGTRFAFLCGPVQVTLQFLSPISPFNLTEQSIPFSYFVVESVAVVDRRQHDVGFYTDVTGEWVSTNDNNEITWDYTESNGLAYHTAELKDQYVFAEQDDSPMWGRLYYGTSLTPALSNSLTRQSGPISFLRSLFSLEGHLYSISDPQKPRPIHGNGQKPAFAFSVSLGTVGPTSPPSSGVSFPLTFAVGHVRDPVIHWTALGLKNGMERRGVYSLGAFDGNVEAMLSSFLASYPNAVAESTALDDIVTTQALKTSSDYASIVALSARQAMASMEITVGRNAVKNKEGDIVRAGEGYNTSDVLTFMKEISSNGNMNTIDVIFPAMPIMLYLNPELLGHVLDPNLLYAKSGNYPNDYCGHDLGAHYPNATGHNDGHDEYMPVEESGNIITALLAMAIVSGDTSRLYEYYPILRQWTQYLIEDGLIPAHQLSTDDFAGPLANQTNLALKAILAIEAMSKISAIVGDDEGVTKYSGIAHDYIKEWEGYAMSEDGAHLKLAYHLDDSWGLWYSAWADKLLNLSLIPERIWDTQTKWYDEVAQEYGIPLDTRHTYSKTDWTVWTSAIVTKTSTRDRILGGLRKFLASGEYDRPLPDWYDVISGRSEWFADRPVVGAHFAFLAEHALEKAREGRKEACEEQGSKFTFSSHVHGCF